MNNSREAREALERVEESDEIAQFSKKKKDLLYTYFKGDVKAMNEALELAKGFWESPAGKKAIKGAKWPSQVID